MTRPRIRHLPLRHSLPGHLRAWTLDEVRKLRALAEQGCTVADIARELRRSRCAVYSRAVLHGIVLPAGSSSGSRRRP
jgi:hypothetical protein